MYPHSGTSASLPLVTTVITSYNKGEFLAAAIDSALAQTYPSHEIIVVDDGSTDNTPDIARSYGDRIRYIAQENQGQCSAKNRGIDEAQGEYIAFLDGDDIWRPTKLEIQMAVFARSPHLGLVYTNALKFSEHGIVMENYWANRQPQRGWVLDHVLVDSFIPFSSVVVKRSSVLEAGSFDLEVPVACDYDLWLRMARLCEFDYVEDVLLEYRISDNNISNRVGSKFHHVERIRRRFFDRFYGGRFPNQKALAQSESLSFSRLGDMYLSHGRRKNALVAYLSAIRWEPLRARRYVSVVRALLPDRVASLVKTVLPVQFS